MRAEQEPVATVDEDLAILDAAPVSFSIFSLARSHRMVAAGFLAPLGLHPSQEILLMRLWEHDRRSQKELARCLGVDQSTVARTVQRMEVGGFVSRLASVEDGRVTLVCLTDSGRALREQVMDAWRALEQRSISGLSSEEQDKFVALAQKIASTLDAGAETERG